MKKKLIFSIFMTALMNCSFSVHAVDGEAAMNFKGTLIQPPPCIINGNTPIEVDFKDMLTTNINGSNYRQNVPYTLSCTTATSTSVKLQIIGNVATGFGNGELATTLKDLAIKLSYGASNTNLPVNTWLNFTSTTPPLISAVPVKNVNAVLTNGKFTAGATMQVAYQ